MTQTSFPTTPAMPEPYAHGYYAGEDGKGEFRDYTASNPAVAWTAGAMISTLDDLKVWAKALATGALLKPETHAEQMKYEMIPAGKISVGYGLGIADFGGLIGHNGAIFGYSTAMFYVPAADATIVIEGNLASNFSNCGDRDRLRACHGSCRTWSSSGNGRRERFPENHRRVPLR